MMNTDIFVIDLQGSLSGAVLGTMTQQVLLFNIYMSFAIWRVTWMGSGFDLSSLLFTVDSQHF